MNGRRFWCVACRIWMTRQRKTNGCTRNDNGRSLRCARHRSRSDSRRTSAACSARVRRHVPRTHSLICWFHCAAWADRILGGLVLGTGVATDGCGDSKHPAKESGQTQSQGPHTDHRARLQPHLAGNLHGHHQSSGECDVSIATVAFRGGQYLDGATAAESAEPCHLLRRGRDSLKAVVSMRGGGWVCVCGCGWVVDYLSIYDCNVVNTIKRKHLCSC